MSNSDPNRDKYGLPHLWQEADFKIEIHLNREFGAHEQFDPLELAGKKDGFEMYHEDCGGLIKLILPARKTDKPQKRAWLRNLLAKALVSRLRMKIFCQSCGKTHVLPWHARSELRQTIRTTLLKNKALLLTTTIDPVTQLDNPAIAFRPATPPEN